MLGGDGLWFAQPQGKEVRHGGLAHAFGLVGQKADLFLVELAQGFGDVAIRGQQAGLGVDDEQDLVGFLDGGAGLGLGEGGQVVAGFRHEAAGVDDDEALALVLAAAVLAVAGQAWKVRHQRVAGAGEAVEQGRFADVGAADQGENGRGHGGIVVVAGSGHAEA